MFLVFQSLEHMEEQVGKPLEEGQGFQAEVINLYLPEGTSKADTNLFN